MQFKAYSTLRSRGVPQNWEMKYLEDFRLALAENRGVIIAVRAGGFAVLQGILTIHFKGNAGILADHVKLLAFLCAVAIESESAVSTA